MLSSAAIDPVTATRWVVWGGLVLGVVLGAVGQATRFCVRGGIADWIIFRGAGRLVSWLLAVAIAAVLIQALVSLQLFDAKRAVPWSERFLWLSYLVGGAVFGFGMMLGGGCPQRNLVKAGSGDLKALVVLVVTAIAALMTLRGLFAVLRTGGLDPWGVTLSGPQDIGTMLAGPAAAQAVRWVVALAMLAAVLVFAWRVRSGVAAGHWVGGVLVGLLVPAAYYLTGHIGYLAEHPETLEQAWLGTQSRRPEGLTFSAPLAHSLDLLTLWSDKSTVATFGVMVALGVVLGAFASARLRGDFRVESFSTPRELKLHLTGGVLMGFGGVTAVGCSIGNGLTGLAMLSTGAVLAVAGITAGALLAMRLEMNHEAVRAAGGLSAQSA